jgi:hypothetical protein
MNSETLMIDIQKELEEIEASNKEQTETSR